MSAYDPDNALHRFPRRGLWADDDQVEVGVEGYDKGAEILYGFFRRELPKFLEEDLDPEARRIIDCCLDGGTLDDYLMLATGASGREQVIP